jgi:2-dehydro-3-deoxygluconokinase
MTRVLCVGECMIELTHVDGGLLRPGFAGDTYNSAIYLRRAADQLGLEVEVGYLTGLGTDDYSGAMRRAWRAEHIIDRSITVADKLPGLYTVRTASDGERHFTYWRESSAAHALFSDGDFCRHLDGDLVHLSGITLQLASPDTRAALIDRLAALRDRGAKISFDTNYRPTGWPSAADAARAIQALCETADIVLASREDETLLYEPSSAERSIQRLHALGATEVVLRDGAAGAHVSQAGTSELVPAQTVATVVDTTAAGDAFAGGYLAARLNGAPPHAAAAVGNTVAAVVIQYPGAIAPPDVRLVDSAESRDAPPRLDSHRHAGSATHERTPSHG